MEFRIDALATTAGFLKDAPVRFSPGLTCIIGARGTCKSTIVETVRFVFDCDQERVKLLCTPPESPQDDGPSTRGLIHATLQGGLAKCTVTRTAPEGADILTIEREIGTEPRIYHAGIQELVDRSILHAVEIYSQGDLQRIAQDESLRLELVDRPNKAVIDTLRAEQDGAGESLQKLGPRIREKAAEIEARRADARALETLRSQLEELQSQRPELSDELDTERAAALRRKSLLERLRGAVVERDAACTALRHACSSEIDFGTLIAELRELNLAPGTELAEKFQRFGHIRDALLRDLAALSTDELTTDVDAVETAFEQQNARYYVLRQEQQEVNDSLKREDALKRNIAQLEKVQRELNQFLQERQQLLDQRAGLRVRLEQISDQIYELRAREVDRINSRHSDVVILTLDQGSRSAKYAKALSALLQGSRLRAQEEVARDLAANVRPCDLIDITEGGDSQRLASLLDRDLGQMARLISFLMDRPELYALEGVVFEDHLEITMYDRDTPKPISQLSKGQMATALLPLILRPAAYPLIFDQPEDDLDNSFIYKTLVEHIQELKQERQLIFVTHNANIPVLGDADTVVVMEMQTPTQAKPPVIDDVEGAKSQILDILEGGSEAFRRRQKRYSPLLTAGQPKDASR